MAKILNPCIITFFMDNIDMKLVGLHRDVVQKFNRSKYAHYSVHTELRHGASMDMAWQLNGVPMNIFKDANVPKKWEHDAIIFLDVDAVPLTDYAIDDLVDGAMNGELIGNIQRSNHIQNDQHVFVAPSVLAVSKQTFVKMGCPSGLETPRADVAEEYTFAAEASNISVTYFMPLSFDEAPAESPSWALKDGMPVYGRGTTFGMGANPVFWHNFQSFHPNQPEKFMKKCSELLNK